MISIYSAKCVQHIELLVTSRIGGTNSIDKMFQQTLQTGTRSMQAEQIDRSLHHLSSLLNNGTDPNTVKQHADEIIGHLEELTFQIDKNTSTRTKS